MQPIAITQRMDETANDHLGLGVLVADPSHALTSFFRRESIHKKTIAYRSANPCIRRTESQSRQELSQLTPICHMKSLRGSRSTNQGGRQFAEVLKKELPRVPLLDDFATFARVGRDLAAIHVGYEVSSPGPLCGGIGRTACPRRGGSRRWSCRRTRPT